jgi:BirA family biotin operon repressor/biotin-[acetyl-CoA-carboxylase] ligase
MFDLCALETSLADTIFTRKLHFARVTNSTNTDALEAARAGAPHGSVYFADEQLAGRGRSNHTWHSAAGEGLYVSILLRPQIPSFRLPFLPLVAGLAASAAIRDTANLNVDLRWPNDLLIGPRKAGGILVEAQAESNNIAFAVIGIGINVHQRSFDPALATPATSLDLESGAPSARSTSQGWKSGRTISRQPLLVALLKSLEREAIALLDPAEASTIPRRVEKASTWMRGRQVEVHGPQACTGITAGLDNEGFLLVLTSNGLVRVTTGGIRSAQIV